MLPFLLVHDIVQRDYACPTCGISAGQPCVTKRGNHAREMHLARLNLADEQDYAEQEAGRAAYDKQRGAIEPTAEMFRDLLNVFHALHPERNPDNYSI